MHASQPKRRTLPTVWLMTDERADASLEAALHRLPRGSGVVFRHYSLPRAERRARYETVRAIARRRGLLLILAGPTRDAIAWRADGAHNRGPYGPATRALFRTAPAHDAPDRILGRPADGIFLSPVFPTRSHPGARKLGRIGFGRAARLGGNGVIALGGMTPRRWRSLRSLGAVGWAAIDAWSEF